ncbi:hypothetical protein KP509_24G056500 [Ceratopteris richardii]|uniref:Transcription initiation factor TFIID subunit 8 n=1 Tax=Ceratopteris richardii TaxID=49495 RepID=A0A8T2RXY2_CERRI|nr:hypothetical protein KP509_24G056500 [Ceratopteris richardii]
MNVSGRNFYQRTSSNENEESADVDENPLCTDADEFPRALAKTAVAQICEAAGFQAFQLSALDKLADIAIRYLSDTAKASQFYANISGRTQSNAIDVLCAVEDINEGGLVHAHKAMSTSDIPSQLKRFIEYTEEIPFCKPIPKFPIRKRPALTPTFSTLGEKPPGGHIPSWLPAFPDVHTYKSTPIWNERKGDPRKDKLEQAKQRRKAERSLLSLHLRLSAKGSSEIASVENASHDMKLWGTPQVENLNIGSPSKSDTSSSIEMEGATSSIQKLPISTLLPRDAKEDSSGVLHGFKASFSLPNNEKSDGSLDLPSVLEVFAPALEAATLTIQETTGTTDPSNSRRRMQSLVMSFDYGSRVKEKSAAALLSLQKKEKKWVLPELKDDEKDEKKRRALQILEQSLGTFDEALHDTRH